MIGSHRDTISNNAIGTRNSKDERVITTCSNSRMNSSSTSSKTPHSTSLTLTCLEGIRNITCAATPFHRPPTKATLLDRASHPSVVSTDLRLDRSPADSWLGSASTGPVCPTHDTRAPHWTAGGSIILATALLTALMRLH